MLCMYDMSGDLYGFLKADKLSGDLYGFLSNKGGEHRKATGGLKGKKTREVTISLFSNIRHFFFVEKVIFVQA